MVMCQNCESAKRNFYPGPPPLQRALKEAQEDLEATQKILDEAKEQLAKVESGIAALQAKYEDSLANKEELDNKFQLCGARLIRADKVRRMGEVKPSFRLIFAETCCCCTAAFCCRHCATDVTGVFSKSNSQKA